MLTECSVKPSPQAYLRSCISNGENLSHILIKMTQEFHMTIGEALIIVRGEVFPRTPLSR